MQVRGLKLYQIGLFFWLLFAPHAGAWIETIFGVGISIDTTFAPHAGAWIETAVKCTCGATFCSHLMQVRGLKRYDRHGIKSRHVSHLMQVRGLKRNGRM